MTGPVWGDAQPADGTGAPGPLFSVTGCAGAAGDADDAGAGDDAAAAETGAGAAPLDAMQPAQRVPATTHRAATAADQRLLLPSSTYRSEPQPPCHRPGVTPLRGRATSVSTGRDRGGFRDVKAARRVASRSTAGGVGLLL